MISSLHLLWIVPLSVFFGIVIASIMQAAGAASRREEKWEREKENS